MYIRRTQTRSNATGEPYFTYRLVRSERIDGKVKQVTLLNLGRHFAVDQSLWPALCVRIDELLAGQASLVEIDLPKAAAVEAERITAQLQAHKAPAVPAPAQARSETKPDAQPQSEDVPATDVQAMDVNSLELVRPRSIGVEQFGLWAMRQVNFSELLRELGLSSPTRAAILGFVWRQLSCPVRRQLSWPVLVKKMGYFFKLCFLR